MLRLINTTPNMGKYGYELYLPGGYIFMMVQIYGFFANMQNIKAKHN